MTEQLSNLREEIDALDNQLVSILNERATITVDIAAIKKELENEGIQPNEPHVPAREIEIYNQIKKVNNGPLSNKTLMTIFREIMSASISLNKDVKIGYLGPRGTFTHQAAVNRFGDSVIYSAQKMIADVFSAVEKRQVTYGVVPFENSIHGTVSQTIEKLVKTTAKIRADIYLPVHHQFLSKSSDLTEITKIYSHPEALGQCSKWLNAKMRNVQKIPVSSTSYAAELASKEVGAGAICGIVCADIYGLKVLDKNVEDRQGNTTRFIILGQTFDGPTGNDKTLFSFTVDHHQPGALCNALAAFKQNNINMTKIDSIPSNQRNWHYVFILEAEGHIEEEGMKNAYEELKKYCSDINVLGSYPISKE